MPTRELAVQVRDECVKLSHGRKIHSVAVYGGKPIRQQIEKLSRGAEIVVGTPGRVLDQMGRGTLKLDDLTVVVLDEADRMLDIGFRPDIEKILRRCPHSRQTLLLERHDAAAGRAAGRAATCASRRSLDFSPKDIAVETIEQFYFTVDPERKFELLENAARAREAAAGDRLLPHQARHRQGRCRGWPSDSRTSTCIHGDLQQSARDRVMAAFPRGQGHASWWPPTWWAAAST